MKVIKLGLKTVQQRDKQQNIASPRPRIQTPGKQRDMEKQRSRPLGIGMELAENLETIDELEKKNTIQRKE